MAKKWAMITGAGSGIGWSTAIEFARLGFNLCIMGRRQERLELLQDEINADFQVVVKCFQIDIRNKNEIDDFFAQQAIVLPEDAFLPHVEILVNNAGLAKGVEKIQEARTEDWDEMIDTNFRGLLYMTRGVLPFMLQKNSGHIVNLGSVAGRWVYPGGGVYCATKFAVRVLSEALRMDLLGKQIRVTNIEPGMVDTEFSEVRFNGDKLKAKEVYQGMTPLSAKDVAETISWCVQRPAHVNIQELVLFPTDQAAVGQVFRSN